MARQQGGQPLVRTLADSVTGVSIGYSRLQNKGAEGIKLTLYHVITVTNPNDHTCKQSLHFAASSQSVFYCECQKLVHSVTKPVQPATVSLIAAIPVHSLFRPVQPATVSLITAAPVHSVTITVQPATVSLISTTSVHRVIRA